MMQMLRMSKQCVFPHVRLQLTLDERRMLREEFQGKIDLLQNRLRIHSAHVQTQDWEGVANQRVLIIEGVIDQFR